MSPVPEEERDKPTQDTSDEIEDTAAVKSTAAAPKNYEGGISTVSSVSETQEYPDVVINVDSSDSDNDDYYGGDDGDAGYMGYQTLSQDVTGADSDEEDKAVSSSTEVETTLQSQQAAQGPEVPMGLIHSVRHEDFPNSPNLPRYMQVPDVPRVDKTEMLWNQPISTDIKLDTGQADKIKSVMTGIRLPSSNIPDWAKTLSDDQWQAQVMNRLKQSSPKQEVDVSQTRDSTDVDTKESS